MKGKIYESVVYVFTVYLLYICLQHTHASRLNRMSYVNKNKIRAKDIIYHMYSFHLIKYVRSETFESESVRLARLCESVTLFKNFRRAALVLQSKHALTSRLSTSNLFQVRIG